MLLTQSYDCHALFRLGFPSAPELRLLNLATYRNSQAHSTKGTIPPLRAIWFCWYMVSGSISLPLPGFFSPFPHGTCPLSVATEYLALDRGRPRFRQSFSCSAVLRCCLEVKNISCTRLSLSLTSLPKLFHYIFELLLHISSPTTPLKVVWALPISLAATFGISIDFFSRVT